MFLFSSNGELAQLARALDLHSRGHRFDSDILHFFVFLQKMIFDMMRTQKYNQNKINFGCASKIVNQIKLKRIVIYRLIKSIWGIPRLSEAMKDVISCDKLRLVAHTL